ncbi:MAG: hypothetical protein HMLKMBBP_01779 [Planctomycetes bacterium]|nr:hypothetical protein [Planctomycetota bacterium]
MARERRPRRGAEAEAPAEEVVVAEPMAEARGGRERPAKVPTGPSFALPTAFMAGLVAAVLAFVAVTVVGGMVVKDPAETLDQGGIQAVRMLAAAPSDFWRPGFGSSAEVRRKAEDDLSAKLGQIPDKREQEIIKSAFEDWKRGVNRSGKDWRPGLDLLYPPNDPRDTTLESQKKSGLKTAQGTQPGSFLGAVILTSDSKATSLAEGAVSSLPREARPVATLGATNVYVVSTQAGLARVYTHPVFSREGKPDGTAYVSLRAPDGASLGGAGGAAAGAAFLGAFLTAFLLSLGPVKAVRKLAVDTEAAAKGDLSVKISAQGPDVVQAAAKNVQRILANAQAASASVVAVPQIVTQQVVVQPTAEIAEGLSPSRAFKRPDDVEIESTQKTCPDVGNDYFDVINVDEDNVGLFVADIPNMRGVRGALYMAQVRALFRAVAYGERSPAEMLKLLNRAFAKELPRGVYVTALYAVYTRSTGIVRVASAQHLPLVLWKAAKKASAKLHSEGIALGLDAGPVFDKTIAEKAVQLEKADRIFLFTDGAIQAKNAGGAQYGDERFYYVLNREAPKNSAACVNFVANDFDLFHEGAAQVDDLTLVTLRKMK